MNKVFKHVLVATDGSALADKAVELAMQVACDEEVTALMVVHDYGLADYARATFGRGPDVQALRQHIIDEGERRLADALSRATRHARRVNRQVVIGEQAPYHDILATAERAGCDLIVMASHGHGGVVSAVLGSQTLKVLSLAKVPVLVAR